MKKTEWTMDTLDNQSAFMRNIASNTTIKHKNTIIEKVLDKISTEIDQKQYDFMSDGDYNEGIRFGLMLAYQIIDKYKAEIK